MHISDDNTLGDIQGDIFCLHTYVEKEAPEFPVGPKVIMLRKRQLKHLCFVVEPACPTWLGRGLDDDLRYALAVVTAHGEGVFSMLEGPIITPDDPSQIR